MTIFAPVGQMAFTNYLSQAIITSIFFYGFGWYARLQRYEVYYVVGAIWLFQIIFSHIWCVISGLVLSNGCGGASRTYRNSRCAGKSKKPFLTLLPKS